MKMCRARTQSASRRREPGRALSPGAGYLGFPDETRQRAKPPPGVTVRPPIDTEREG
jgi:hypothetical protein